MKESAMLKWAKGQGRVVKADLYVIECNLSTTKHSSDFLYLFALLSSDLTDIRSAVLQSLAARQTELLCPSIKSEALETFNTRKDQGPVSWRPMTIK